MNRSQRGMKRNCPACGVRFYDMMRTPIVCPGCSSEFSADDFNKPKRSRPTESTPPPPPPPKAKAKAVVDDDDDLDGVILADDSDDDADDSIDDVDDDDEDDALIEDASELGEDEDDMAEVIGNVEEPAETEER